MVLVDKNVIDAVTKVKELSGSYEAAGKQLFISGNHVKKIITGKTQVIKDSTFLLMEPALKSHLKISSSKPSNIYIPGQDHLPLQETETMLLDYFRKFDTDEKIKCLNCMREKKFCGEGESPVGTNQSKAG